MRNRILEWLPHSRGSDGAFTHMAKGPMEAASKSEAAPNVPAAWTDEQRATAAKNQPVIAKLINTRWKGKDVNLAAKIGVSQSGLSNLKRLGAHEDTPTLHALCAELAVDPYALLKGKIVNVKPTFKRPDLHAILDSLVGTADEPAIERMLQAFAKASKS